MPGPDLQSALRPSDTVEADVARGPWTLAIDFGSTSTVVVAADPVPVVVEVDGERSMPSVVFVDDDDTLIVGTSAVHLSATRPDRCIRSPKRRLGSRSPIVVGGQAHSSVSLAAAVIARGADAAITQVGRPPTEVRLTYPAMWGAAARSRLVEAAQEAGLSAVALVPEPVAAALSLEDATPIGSCLAIYDMGGGTFDTALVERTTSGFRVIGRPAGTDDVGGELLDEAIMASIGERLDPDTWERIQVADGSDWAQANVDLLAECRRVKEAVSSHSYGEIRVSTPDGVIHERVTRDEIEAIVAPHLDQTIDLLGDVLALGDDGLHGVHLVGGGSRMPLVRAMIEAAHPDVVIRSSGDPRTAAAMGAAIAHGSAATTSREHAGGVPAEPVAVEPAGAEPVGAGPVDSEPVVAASSSGQGPWRVLAALVVAVAVFAGGAVMVNAMIRDGSAESADGEPSIGSEAASSDQSPSPSAADQAADLGSERVTPTPSEAPASGSSEDGDPVDPDAPSGDADADPLDADAEGSDEPPQDALNGGTTPSDALGPVSTDIGSTLDGTATYVVTTTERTACPTGRLQLRDLITGELGDVLVDVEGAVELVEGPQGTLVLVERCGGDFVRLRSGSQLSGRLDPATLSEATLSPRPARLELLAFDFIRQILVGDALFADSGEPAWQEVEVNLGDGGVLVVGPSTERPRLVLGSEGLAVVDQLTGVDLQFVAFGSPSAEVVDRVAQLRAGTSDLVAASGCEGEYLVAVFDGITLTFLPDGRFAGWFLRPDALSTPLSTANGITLGTTIEELEVAGGRLLLNPAESGTGGFVLQIGDDATGTAGLLSGFSLDDEPSSPLLELGAGQNCAALVAADES